jgi:hypothetical protein
MDEEAIKWFEQARRLNPMDGTIDHHHGTLQALKLDRDRAFMIPKTSQDVRFVSGVQKKKILYSNHSKLT